MSRQIKFRAWHKKNKEMYVVDELLFGLKQGEGIVRLWLGDEERDGCFSVFFKEVELIQFTGLKDKNGKEIYEGDIVECKFEGKDEVVDTFIVRWEQDNKNNGWNFRFGEGISKDNKVIGNIYENSELLKEV